MMRNEAMPLTAIDTLMTFPTAPTLSQVTLSKPARKSDAPTNSLDSFNCRSTLVADGKVYRKKSDLVFITNVNFVWPWKFSTREGLRVDDGKLDIFIMREASLAGWLSILFFMVFSRAGKDPRITHIQAKRIALHSYPEAPMQIDGEAKGVTPFSVEVIPKAIKVIVPKT